MPTTISNQQPYKHLAYFDAHDAALFFGRESEKRALLERINNNRMVLLYGVAGVGKTSLLLAGLNAAIKQQKIKQEIIYVRITGDPIPTIQQTLINKMADYNIVNDEKSQTIEESTADINTLHQEIKEAFSDSEFKSFCTLTLDIDYEQLEGKSPNEKKLELLLYCERRGQIPFLLSNLKKERPHRSWPTQIGTPQNNKSSSEKNNVVTNNLNKLIRQASLELDVSFIIVLDQFEHFFTLLDSKERSNVVQTLTTIYEQNDLPAKLVLSVREDFLVPTIDEFVTIPDLLLARYRYSLPLLTPKQAREAIEKPLEQVDMSCEEALVQQLLTDLSSSKLTNKISEEKEEKEEEQSASIMPTTLQLACYMLVATLPASEKRLTLGQYKSNKIRGMHGILSRFLEEQLKGLLLNERKVANDLLLALVSPLITKRIVPSHELATVAQKDFSIEQAHTVLEKLTKLQLIRPLEIDHAISYELVHDYLAEYLAQKHKLEGEAKIQKAIADLVQQEVQNWQKLNTLISSDKLKIIQPWYEQNKDDLAPEIIELIKKSLAQRELNYAEYLRIIENDKINMLTQLVSGIDKEISSPIAAINSNSELLPEYVEDIKTLTFTNEAEADIDIQQTFQHITNIAKENKEAARKMTKLIEVLSNFAEPQSSKINVGNLPESPSSDYTPIDLKSIIEATLLLLEHITFKHNIKIDHNIKTKESLSRSLMVKGSSSQLMQLFVNLLDNCIKALTNNSETAKPQIKITVQQVKEEIITIIVHNGQSTKPELNDNFFDFNIEQDGINRQGLNLTIAYQIAQRHKGTISIPPAKPNKTAFKVVLPATNK